VINQQLQISQYSKDVLKICRQFKDEVQHLNNFAKGTHKDILMLTIKKGIPMSYSHLSITERSQLYKLRVTEKLSMSVIANIMKRSKSKISRELKRNIDNQHQVYLPDTAEEMKKTRRAKSKERFKGVNATTIEEVKQRLEQYHSPEQLAGRMKQEGLASVSHETIYQMIYADHQGMGFYKQYLRQKQKQRRRKGVTQK
jgi:transposase, IS30 family